MVEEMTRPTFKLQKTIQHSSCPFLLKQCKETFGSITTESPWLQQASFSEKSCLGAYCFPSSRTEGIGGYQKKKCVRHKWDCSALSKPDSALGALSILRPQCNVCTVTNQPFLLTPALHDQHWRVNVCAHLVAKGRISAMGCVPSGMLYSLMKTPDLTANTALEELLYSALPDCQHKGGFSDHNLVSCFWSLCCKIFWVLLSCSISYLPP